MHKPPTNRTSENRWICGVPNRVRTCDLLIKRHVLIVAKQGGGAQTEAEHMVKQQTVGDLTDEPAHNALMSGRERG